MQLAPGTLAPQEDRLRPFLNLAAQAVAAQFLTERGLRAGGVVWPGGWQWQLVQLALAVAAGAAAQMLRVWPRRLRWGVPGAPRRPPAGELLADVLASAASLFASVTVTRLPALYLAVFGPLAPAWLGQTAGAGRHLLAVVGSNSKLEAKLAGQAAGLAALFQARPAALAALHAAVLAGHTRSGARFADLDAFFWL